MTAALLRVVALIQSAIAKNSSLAELSDCSGSAIARPDQSREIVGVYFREPQATSEIYSNPPKAAEGEGEVLTITPAGNSGTIRVSNGGGS
jgi:hypothetical protein